MAEGRGLKAVTGWDFPLEECLATGERIANVRHAFNLREGLNPLKFRLPGRMMGNPPLETGNVRGVTVDLATQVREFCRAMGWDAETAMPDPQRLEELGLGDVAKDLGLA